MSETATPIADTPRAPIVDRIELDVETVYHWKRPWSVIEGGSVVPGAISSYRVKPIVSFEVGDHAPLRRAILRHCWPQITNRLVTVLSPYNTVTGRLVNVAENKLVLLEPGFDVLTSIDLDEITFIAEPEPVESRAVRAPGT